MILQTNRSLANLIGFDAFGRNGRWIGFLNAYILLSFCAWYTVTTANFVLTINDFKKFVENSLVACGCLIVSVVYARFLISHDRFVLLLDDIQDIVSESSLIVNPTQ